MGHPRTKPPSPRWGGAYLSFRTEEFLSKGGASGASRPSPNQAMTHEDLIQQNQLLQVTVRVLQKQLEDLQAEVAVLKAERRATP